LLDQISLKILIELFTNIIKTRDLITVSIDLLFTRT
jgi:hypothetical protein